MKALIHKTAIFSGIMIALIYLSSCSTTSTVVTGSWKKESIDKEYKNIVVEAFLPTAENKSALEMQMVKGLKEKGIEASAYGEELPAAPIQDEDTKDEILQEISDKGNDGILTISVIDRQAESRYVPGASPYAPYPRYPYYGSFWGYYDYWYPYFYGPGYYALENVYYIETNLFDAETEELVWSAQSKTYEHRTLETFSRDYAKEVIEELIEDNVI
jgi:hypothetical protein